MCPPPPCAVPRRQCTLPRNLGDPPNLTEPQPKALLVGKSQSQAEWRMFPAYHLGLGAGFIAPLPSPKDTLAGCLLYAACFRKLLPKGRKWADLS